MRIVHHEDGQQPQALPGQKAPVCGGDGPSKAILYISINLVDLNS